MKGGPEGRGRREEGEREERRGGERERERERERKRERVNMYRCNNQVATCMYANVSVTHIYMYIV